MADRGSIFGQKATAQIEKAVREVLRRVMNYPGQHRTFTGVTDKRRAVLAEDMTAPASPLTTMTSADIYFINYLDDGTSELDATGPYTAWNDDPDFEPERGTLIRVEELAGKWMISWAACAPNAALITALDAL